MNTNNQTTQNENIPTQTYPGTLSVWIDANGYRCAAQRLGANKVGFCKLANNETGRIKRTNSGEYLNQNLSGTTTAQFFSELEATTYAIKNSDFDRDGLSWIEARELERAARDQNPIPSRSLADAISYPERCKIDDETREEIISLLTKRCRAETTATIRRRLQNIDSLKNYGIYDRLQISPTVSYCAGQDYPGEIRTIRELLIKN